jgi:glycosyltransferase involved in cell wall biosynthesis
MSGLINRISNWFLLPFLRAQMQRLDFGRPILLWTYTPHSADFIGKLGEHAAVYECVDDFTSARGLIDPQAIGEMERRLIRAVDLLIVTADALMVSKGDGARRAVLVPNGVEADHFARASDPALPMPDSVSKLRHPVIGLLGVLNYWIDTELLARIATQHPDWTVLHVGPRELLANMAPLEGVPNFITTGRVPYPEVPRYVKAFDVCVNPYVLDGVAEHCSPLKLYEYIATGKPVVSVDMPEAQKFAGLIRIARDADDFLAQVEQAAQSEDGLGERRMAEAQRHTWRSRFEDVTSALRLALEDRQPS